MPAPRKALGLKRKLEFSNEVKEDVVNKLAAIRHRNAPRMLELSTAARKLLQEMSSVEDEMEAEALEAHEEYYAVAPHFKLTFEHVSRRDAELNYDEGPNLDVCNDYVKNVEDDAAAAVAYAHAERGPVRRLHRLHSSGRRPGGVSVVARRAGA